MHEQKSRHLILPKVPKRLNVKVIIDSNNVHFKSSLLFPEIIIV